MLKQQNRLGKSEEIGKVFARGRSFFNSFFTVKYLQGAKKNFAVVVSTKVFKKAVRRNRLKRIIREYVRKNFSQLKAGSYIIIAKPKISGLPEDQVMRALEEVCSKLK